MGFAKKAIITITYFTAALPASLSCAESAPAPIDYSKPYLGINGTADPDIQMIVQDPSGHIEHASIGITGVFHAWGNEIPTQRYLMVSYRPPAYGSYRITLSGIGAYKLYASFEQEHHRAVAEMPLNGTLKGKPKTYRLQLHAESLVLLKD